MIRRSIETKQEQGAAFCVYYKGQAVVDMWGGYADYDALRLRKRDSTSMFYSATKAITAIVLAVLVDRYGLKLPVYGYMHIIIRT